MLCVAIDWNNRLLCRSRLALFGFYHYFGSMQCYPNAVWHISPSQYYFIDYCVRYRRNCPESFWEGILLGNAFFIAGNNIIFLIIAIFTSIFSKNKKIDPWRMECRTAFESAAQEIKNSPLGNYGFSTLAIGPRLGEVKEQLYEKVMWENKSQEILDEEFQIAIKKYIG